MAIVLTTTVPAEDPEDSSFVADGRQGAEPASELIAEKLFL